MKDVFLFPILTGNLAISGKNAVVCNVNSKGQTNIQSNKNKFNILPHKNIWFLRGIEYLIFATFYFFKGLNKGFKLINKKEISQSSRKTKENSSVENKSYIFITIITILSIIFGVIILGLLPTYLGFWISSGNYSLFVKKLCIGLTKCAVLYLILVAFYFIPSINNFYRLNSAGNAVLNKEDDILKHHRATNYLNFMVFSLLFSYFVISLIGFNISPWLKPFANLGVLLVCFSISFEFLNLLDTKWLKYKQITMFTSWLVNAKPNQTEMQTARACLCEVLLMQENSEREIINTNNGENIAFSFVYAEAKEKFKKGGVEDISELDWLLSIFLNVPKLELKFLATITKTQYKQIQDLINRRIKGEPIAKIFGWTEFYGLKFKVDKNVLTPRQETELLVENALKLLENIEKPNVLDLCTGSGAIGIAIAKNNSDAKVFASDISEKALSVAKENANNLKAEVNFIESDLFNGIKKKKFFDMIVSNPPYIKTDVIKTLDKEVKDHDPALALDGGIDGLYFYKKFAEEAPKFLTKNGQLLLEIGFDQAKEVKKLLTDNFINIKILKDYSGQNRIIIADKKN